MKLIQRLINSYKELPKLMYPLSIIIAVNLGLVVLSFTDYLKEMPSLSHFRFEVIFCYCIGLLIYYMVILNYEKLAGETK